MIPKINRDTPTVAAGETEEIGKRKCQKQRGVLNILRRLSEEATSIN